MTAYLDGASLGSQSIGSLNTVLDGSGLLIGQRNFCCESLHGSVDEVAVYATALTATQVLAHYNAAGYSSSATPTNVTAVAGANQAAVSWAGSSPDRACASFLAMPRNCGPIGSMPRIGIVPRRIVKSWGASSPPRTKWRSAAS